MIERYSRKVMRDVWTEENKFGAYLEVETLSCEAWSKLGVIPAEDVEKIRANARFEVSRIREIEEQTRHDVVAFPPPMWWIPPTDISSSRPTPSS